MKSENKLVGTGVFAAITASLCCITPVLALIAGTSGIASTFSWIDPFRPYLIGLTILVLSYAWYLKLKPKKNLDCECDPDDQPTGKAAKPKFIRSKSFLGLITVFAIIMLSFPYYSGIFYPNVEKHIIVVDKSDISSADFQISGMTCTGCEEHVDHEVNKLDGVLSSKASYKNGNAIVEFDKTKTSISEIEKAINSTGYKVIGLKEN